MLSFPEKTNRLAPKEKDRIPHHISFILWNVNRNIQTGGSFSSALIHENRKFTERAFYCRFVVTLQFAIINDFSPRWLRTVSIDSAYTIIIYIPHIKHSADVCQKRLSRSGHFVRLSPTEESDRCSDSVLRSFP